MNLRESLLSTNIGVESFDNELIDDMEEELLEYQIGQEAFNEVAVDSREIERLSEIAVGLEDLAKICGFVKGASTVDLAFVENATNLALAGTGIKCEEILPSLESYKDGEISTESIKRFALNVWKSITKLQSRVWKNTVRFFNSIFKSVPRLRKSVEDLKLRVDGVREKTLKDGKIDLGNATGTLSIGYEALKDLSTLRDSLEFYNSFTGVLLGEYTSMSAERGNLISKNMKEEVFEKSDAIVELAKLMILPKNPLINAINRSSMKLTAADLSKDERFNSTDNYVKPVGLNLHQSRYFITDDITVKEVDKMLKSNDYGKVGDDEKVKVAIDVLSCATKNRAEIVMAHSTAKKPKLPKKESAEPLEFSDIEVLADHMLMICDYVELNSSSDKLKELEKISDNIEKVTKGLANSLNKRDAGSSSLGSVWRLVANINVAWINMVTKPQSQWTNHVFAVSRAVVSVCNKSLSMYA